MRLVLTRARASDSVFALIFRHGVSPPPVMESCRANLIANLLAQSGAAPEKPNVPLPEPVVSVAQMALQELSAGQ
ncbi:hypothetical protein GCM10009825_37390 [Arthrobacter humicola]|uniref:Uncharacterized protein n=1 Tax=Arthrobacter humicola TaxID=409291 RepID=A0ABN2ZNV8_9MICC